MKTKRRVKIKMNIFLIIMIIALFVITITNSSFSHNEIKYKEIYVANGQTLWEIAETVKANNVNYNNKEIRKIIYELKELNNLEDSSLKVGQKLTIPV